MSRLLGFWRASRAASAAEFALVLPVALTLLFALIDTGRYMWGLNKVEKAAQMGVRYAVVTNPVAGGLTTTNYVGNTSCNGGTPLVAGDTICAAALSPVNCNSAACNPSWGTYNSAAFNAILARTQVFAPSVGSTNLTVSYSGSGLGFAGDPNTQIAPIVSVKLDNLTFQPILLSLFNGSLRYPAVVRSLTLEDGQGTAAD